MNILIVGLGNVGDKYALTRHNIGWMVIDKLKFVCCASKWVEEKTYLFSQCKTTSYDITMLKPLTMMNSSGLAVEEITKNAKFDHIILIHDEMDIPFGEVRKKFGGSRADHRGLRDVVRALGTHDFHRIRCGIGRPDGIPVLQHVLSEFSSSESNSVANFIQSAVDVILDLINALET